MDLQMYGDGTHFVTASNDRSSKLVDTQVRAEGEGGRWGRKTFDFKISE